MCGIGTKTTIYIYIEQGLESIINHESLVLLIKYQYQ